MSESANVEAGEGGRCFQQEGKRGRPKCPKSMVRVRVPLRGQTAIVGLLIASKGRLDLTGKGGASLPMTSSEKVGSDREAGRFLKDFEKSGSGL